MSMKMQLLQLYVVSVCTSIPHSFGLEAVSCFLLKDEEDIHTRFNILFNLESLDFILKNTSDFVTLMFQVTKMDTVFSPTYANLSME